MNSRYYDPEAGRFISPDDISYLDPSSINGLNLYAYCGNNPVIRWDPSGNAWWSVLGTILLDVGLIGLTIITGGAALPLLIGAVAGQVLGGITAAGNGTDIWTGMFTGGVLGAAVGGVFMLGPAALLSASESFIGKFVADFTALTLYGKPMGTWEDYALAFAFGGLIKGFGLSGSAKFFTNVLAIPLVNQLVHMGTGRQKDGFKLDKYGYDVFSRAITYGMPDSWKYIARGALSGFYYDYNKKIKFNIYQNLYLE